MQIIAVVSNDQAYGVIKGSQKLLFNERYEESTFIDVKIHLGST